MRIVCVLLMVCMSLMNKEIDMPNAMKDDVAVKTPVRDVPAWSGKIGGGSNNKGSSFTDAVVSSVAAANTNGGGQWLNIDNKPAPQPAYVRPTAPTPPAWMKPVAAVMIKIEDKEGLVEVSYTVDGEVPENANKYSAALELASYLLAYAESILNPEKDEVAVEAEKEITH